MVEADIVRSYEKSRQNWHDRRIAVHSLRHLFMDGIILDDVHDNAAYLLVYESVMSKISGLYPYLSEEVQRQMRKKKRRQARRSREERKDELHI